MQRIGPTGSKEECLSTEVASDASDSLQRTGGGHYVLAAGLLFCKLLRSSMGEDVDSVCFRETKHTCRQCQRHQLRRILSSADSPLYQGLASFMAQPFDLSSGNLIRMKVRTF